MYVSFLGSSSKQKGKSVALLKKNALHEDYVRPFVRLFVSHLVSETKFLVGFS
jgi:hypothetical protein